MTQPEKFTGPEYQDSYDENLDEITNVLEDFPERDYFEQAGELLREAAEELHNACGTLHVCERYRASQICRGLADQIDRFLQRGEGK